MTKKNKSEIESGFFLPPGELSAVTAKLDECGYEFIRRRFEISHFFNFADKISNPNRKFRVRELVNDEGGRDFLLTLKLKETDKNGHRRTILHKQTLLSDHSEEELDGLNEAMEALGIPKLPQDILEQEIMTGIDDILLRLGFSYNWQMLNARNRDYYQKGGVKVVIDDFIGSHQFLGGIEAPDDATAEKVKKELGLDGDKYRRNDAAYFSTTPEDIRNVLMARGFIMLER